MIVYNSVAVHSLFSMSSVLAADNSKDRVGFFSHTVNREDLIPGDHIYCYRAGGLYAHHGIYVGNNEVVHFSGREKSHPSKAKVESCTLEGFLNGSKLRLVAYNVSFISRLLKRSGTCHCTESMSLKDVLDTANFYLSDPDQRGTYNLLSNNCEHFAVYCKAKRNSSAQVEPHSILKSFMHSSFEQLSIN